MFGKGKELNEAQWKSVIRYLIAYEYISVGTTSFFTLYINEKARGVLQGKVQIIIPAEHYYPALPEDVLVSESTNWHKILAWKYAEGSITLSDTQLRLISLHKPTSIASLSRLTGLPKESVAVFAESLMKVIHETDSGRSHIVCP